MLQTREIAPHPSWLVTDGQLVVGPVSTDLLLRGLTHQRVPGDALVKQPGWREWRRLREVRELAPITDADVAEDLVEHASDFGESAHYALLSAMARTRAATGVVYRNAEPHIGMMATAEKGLSPDLVLGLVLPTHEPIVRHALLGGTIVGSPRAGMLHRLIADRIGGSDALRGVMMVPVRWDGLLVAMIELGRFDHEFRASDVGAAEELARGVSERVARHFGSLLAEGNRRRSLPRPGAETDRPRPGERPTCAWPIARVDPGNRDGLRAGQEISVAG